MASTARAVATAVDDQRASASTATASAGASSIAAMYRYREIPALSTPNPIRVYPTPRNIEQRGQPQRQRGGARTGVSVPRPQRHRERGDEGDRVERGDADQPSNVAVMPRAANAGTSDRGPVTRSAIGSSYQTRNHHANASACGPTTISPATQRRRSATRIAAPDDEERTEARRHHAEDADRRGEHVAAVGRTVVVDEQHDGEEREQRQVVRDLDAEHDVLPPGPEHEQRGADQGRRPRRHAAAPADHGGRAAR